MNPYVIEIFEVALKQRVLLGMTIEEAATDIERHISGSPRLVEAWERAQGHFTTAAVGTPSKPLGEA